MDYIKVTKDNATIYLRLTGTGPEQVEVTDTKTEFRYANTTAPFYGAQAPKLAGEFLAQVTVVNGTPAKTYAKVNAPVEEPKVKGKK